MNRAKSSESSPRDDLDDLESAIQAAQSCLHQRLLPCEATELEGSSRPGAYWCGELEADTTLESDYIIFLYFLSPQRFEEKIQKLARYIREHQLPDGGWNIYRGGPSEVSATVKAYTALKIAGFSAQEPFMIQAREAAIRLGGIEKTNSYTKFYLALIGQLDWSDVPAIPPEVVLLPKFFYINIYEISYWSRAILIPLSILYAHRPSRPLDESRSVPELFAEPRERRPGGPGAPQRPVGTIRRCEDLATQDGSREEQGSGVLKHDALASAPADLSELSAQNLDGCSDALPATGYSLRRGSLDGSPADPRGRERWYHGRGNGNGNGSGKSNGNGNGSRRSLLPAGQETIFSWGNFFLLADRVLKIVERSPIKPLRRLALRRAADWMISRFEDSDGLGAIFPSMCNSVMAMGALGYDLSHPLVVKALGELEELEIEEGGALRIQPCVSPVWDTALAVNALHESGLAASHEDLVESCRWLVSKEVRKPGDWRVRLREVQVSGWYFQFRNEFYPDVDDTAAVVMALERVDPSEIAGIRESIQRGIDWVIDMQCSDGGWAAFDVDVQREVLTKVPYADHNAMLDPACADITGRCLEMLGRFPTLRSLPHVRESVRRAVEFLKTAQEPDGSWYARWGVNYIYGTWQAIKGLVEVGEDPSQEYIRRAARWLKSRQNPDGGWGESCKSYHDTSTRGEGESTASQTAWALMGLIAAGEVDSSEVERGIEYLLRTQEEDGGWTEESWTGTGFPRVFYLRYHYYSLYFPLFALGMYRNARRGSTTVRERDDIALRARDAWEAGSSRLSGLRALLGLSR